MNPIKAIIITIGDELLNGQTIDTNSAFIARTFNNIGIAISERIAISDDANHIIQTLNNCKGKAAVIITTGGLGPTKDDITKKTLANYFGVGMKRDAQTHSHVKEIFEKRNRPFLKVNEEQADVPENCHVLFNDMGTAPGMHFHENGMHYFSLPGVPFEMKYLVEHRVVPVLQSAYQLPKIIHKHIQTVGLGESFLADKIADIENELPNAIKLAYLPSFGKVHLRLTGMQGENANLEKEMETFQTRIAERLEEYVYALDERDLNQYIHDVLTERKLQLSLAESCTGGYVAHLLTKNPGSSLYMHGSVVTYSYEMKKRILLVKDETLEKYGAVSEACVREMAAGLILTTGVDVGIAISGIAGPGGGTDDKPVGTVWIAVGNRDKIVSKCFQFYKDRMVNIESSAVASLEMLRRFIKTEYQ